MARSAVPSIDGIAGCARWSKNGAKRPMADCSLPVRIDKPEKLRPVERESSDYPWRKASSYCVAAGCPPVVT